MIQLRSDINRIEDSDLRIDMMQQTDELLDRSQHLPTGDRVLLEQVMRYGFTAMEISRLSGCSPSTVLRKVKKLQSRLCDPMFRFVTEKEILIPRGLKVTARLIFVDGLSMSKTAEKQKISMHEVRKRVAKIRMLVEAHKQVSSAGKRLC
ncbi:hypothetical protein JD969_09300 [Planctomycetota bacterium]|nr:hypothetical protein JD969_09300 [Planctomycetota bacterium]